MRKNGPGGRRPFRPATRLVIGIFWIPMVAFGACGNDARPTEPDLPPPPDLPTPPAADADRIRPYEENPFYWQYKGEPVLLLGGSDQDNLFNHPDLPPDGLEAHLDLLVSVGGNYVRNTMSSRDDGNLWPFARTADGRYDLDEWDEAYWQRLEDFLEMTHERDIVVQIEVWDRFDFANEPWSRNPFNPLNNINFEPDAIGLPIVVDGHPGERQNPFFRSTPGQEDNTALLSYQEAFVEKLLSVSLPHPHVLYTVSNETNESPAWSAYWADFIRERASEAGQPAQITEMWDAWDLADPAHAHTFDDPDRYTFVDISQNNHQEGQVHWDNAQGQRERIADSPRPMNNVKIYGGPRHGGSFEEGTRKFWRNVLGGMASARFHRPGPQGYGNGLNELARAHIRSMRMLTEEMDVFTAGPRNDLVSDRGDDEAYLMAEVGEAYALYFTDGGSVVLDFQEASGAFSLRWLDVLESSWGADGESTGGEFVRVTAPGRGPWVALLRRR
jgi:hypothetical protein